MSSQTEELTPVQSIMLWLIEKKPRSTKEIQEFLKAARYELNNMDLEK